MLALTPLKCSFQAQAGASWIQAQLSSFCLSNQKQNLYLISSFVLELLLLEMKCENKWSFQLSHTEVDFSDISDASLFSIAMINCKDTRQGAKT